MNGALHLKENLVYVADLLVDELAARGAKYDIRPDPPTIRLVSTNQEPITLQDNGELVVSTPTWRIVGRMPIVSIADLITPPIYVADDASWATADVLDAARAIAGKKFPSDEDAKFVAEEAVFDCAAAFWGFGSFERLAK
jgi:hypothetical protein